MKRHLERVLPYAATLIVGGLLWALTVNFADLGETVDENSQSIAQQRTENRAVTSAVIRSCEVLNAAIVQSQAAQGNPATAILIAAILDGKPEVAAAYQRALKTAPPVLPTINCVRVAADPKYKPFRAKKK